MERFGIKKFESGILNLTYVEATVALLEGLGADALGINCGLGPVQMKEILREL